MTDISHNEAAAYVERLFTPANGYEDMGEVIVTCVTPGADEGTLDVFFEYGNGWLNNGTMTVWRETNGNLYGK